METTIENQLEIPIVVDAGDRRLSHGVPARKLLGGLPLARLIPQDVHSVFDYGHALAVAVAAFLAEAPEASVAAGVLSAGGIGVSLCTDYRLSAARLIPIEVHEVIDYAWGLANMAAPFLLGYRRREPVASAIQIAAGAATLLASLFTDYRAYTRQRIGFTP